MSFAENWQRNSRGWIKFGADAGIRKKLFPEGAMAHPAKANLFMLQSVIDYLYKANELILDPMAGTGSIMIAALSGCKVICIDTSPTYVKLLEESKSAISQHKADAGILVLEGDCMDYLPIPVDHVCFSPPYVQIMAKTHLTPGDIAAIKVIAGRESARQRDIELTANKSFARGDEESLLAYSEGKGNLGMMSEFFHMQRTEQVFAKCLSSLPPHGTMTIITKDHIEAGKRVHLTRKYQKAAERVGFKLVEAFKMEAHGTGFVEIHAKKGVPMVRDEDISLFRK